MKVNSLPFAAALAACSVFAFSAICRAATLTETTAVHASPHAGAPAITFLKAGTQPTPAAGITAPPGWEAVEVPGPHEAYVQNRDFLKSLDLKPGASIYTAPRADAPVLATAEKGDAVEITGLLGKWTQIKLKKTLVGYIQLSPVSEPMMNQHPIVVPAPPVPEPSTPPPAVNSSNPPPAAASSTPPTTTVAASTLAPRLFEGKVVSTRRPLMPRRPYDYQLNDVNGSRIAYLDTSRLPPSEQMDNYVDHIVTIFGPARSINNGQDAVIEIESMQLK